MTELKHQDLSGHLKTLPVNTIPQAVLIWGNDYLCRQAFDTIVDKLLTAKEKELGYELLEGEEAQIPRLIERLHTYSFMLDKLVLAIKQAIFYSTTGSSGYSTDDVATLEASIEKGFPEGHFLIMTTPSMDKRKSFFKTIKSKGLAIDCTVPEGSRQADLMEQETLMRKTMEQILFQSGKTMDRAGGQLLFEKIGFNPEGLCENLQRLIAYCGERPQITRGDVDALVKRTRKDAIYELTNAVADRDTSKALFYAKSILEAGLHPLQILTALANTMRRLTVAKQFILSAGDKRCWMPGYDYNRFRQSTLPAILESDKELKQTLDNWQIALDFPDPKNPEIRKGTSSDLFIAPNPKNTYPVFQTFVKSDKFSMDELIQSIIAVNQVDLRLKSSGSDPAILLDDLIIRLCSPRREP
ncbi:MAG: hypothetical protein V1793_12590 [Pseudomonadota bacterium]